MSPQLETKSALVARAAPLQVLNACHDYAVGTWTNVFVVIWRHETSLGGANTVRIACDRFGAEHPRGVLLLTIIHDKAPAPSQAARLAIADWLRGAHYIRASAVVMEGQTFRAAFVRSVVTGLTLLARQSFPHKVCTLGAAGQLFEQESQRASLPFERGAFANAIVELRARAERAVATAR